MFGRKRPSGVCETRRQESQLIGDRSHRLDGKRFVTDGPFAETREQLGGYFLIDAKHLDEVIGIAARIPMARKGTVEIRPVLAIAGLPTA